MNLNPTPVVAQASYSVARQRFLGVPYRRYITVEIVGHGWTQALRKKDVKYMTLDWLSCTYDKTPDNWKVTVEWL